MNQSSSIHTADEVHLRLKAVENKLGRIDDKIDSIFTACVGTANGSKRGYNVRLELLESFKKSVTWAIGILFIAVASSIIGFIFNLLSKKVSSVFSPTFDQMAGLFQ